MSRLFLAHKERRSEIAASLGLKPWDLIALFHLQTEGGIAQRDLAAQWQCDPSWVTARVDALEKRGLAERRLSHADRRVKEVHLTRRGQVARADAVKAFGEPPPSLTALSRRDLEQLSAVLSKVEIDPDLDPGPASTSL